MVCSAESYSRSVGWWAAMATSCASDVVRVGVIAAMLVMPASAHEWYPKECCSGIDCGPVERAELLSDGSLQLTSSVGTTVVPASFPRQASPDQQMHICMVRYSHFDNMRPVCLFVPQGAPS